MERTLPVTQAAAIRVAPSDDAAAAAQAAPGHDLYVVGLLQDRDWLQVRLPDAQTVGYVHAATVAADEPPPPGKPDPLPVSGRPVVHDTATLTIEDRTVPLDGLQGYGGALADGLQQYLDANGAFVACSLATGAAYRCLTRDGVDVASVALVNGVASMTPDAPASDAVQQSAAQQAHRGIWAAGADPPPPPPPPPPPILPSWETDFYTLYPVVVPDDGPPGVDAYGSVADVAAVVIAGVPVAVVGGQRVILVHDRDRGWGYHDRDGHWRPPSERIDHALDRHFGSHPPAFDARADRMREIGRTPLQRADRREDARMPEARMPEARIADRSPGERTSPAKWTLASQHGEGARATIAPEHARGAAGFAATGHALRPAPSSASSYTRSGGGTPGFVSRGQPTFGASRAPGMTGFSHGTPTGASPFGTARPAFSPQFGVHSTYNPFSGAHPPGASPFGGARPAMPMAMPGRTATPSIGHAAPTPHVTACRKAPC